MTLEELLESNNIIYDPFSTLISRNVILGQGNVFYPSTVLQTLESGAITVGNPSTFTPNCFFYTTGTVTIGNNNLFGDGGKALESLQAKPFVTKTPGKLQACPKIRQP